MAYTNLQKLLDRARSDSTSICDPLQVAAEAAAVVIHEGKAVETKALVQALGDALPPNTSVLERGLAIGMAFTLLAVETSK